MTLSTSLGHRGGIEVKVNLCLALVLYGGKWFMLCPFQFTPGNEPRYLLNRRLGVLQSHSECSGEKKNLSGEISSEEVVDLLQDRLCKGDE